MSMLKRCIVAMVIYGTFCFAALADIVQIVAVEVEAVSGEEYTFHVTLRHADEGWDHYANKWQVVTSEGEVLGERILYHPHVDEQPFTRSLSDVPIPDGTGSVYIRAFDTLHGASGQGTRVTLPAR